MELKQLFTDDDAVSPVIGVILMVAITVILAAVIGAFVLDIGGSQESAPQVQWDWGDNPSSDSVSLSHGGGDTVNSPDQITFSDSNNAGDDGALLSSSAAFNADTITAGDEAELGVGNNTTGTAELIWESSDGSQSSVISGHEYDTN